MGPKEIDIKLQEFEARLWAINKELEDLVKIAKDIEYRAKAIHGEAVRDIGKAQSWEATYQLAYQASALGLQVDASKELG